MEKAKKTWIVLRVIEALILLTIGVLAIVYSDNETFKKIIFYVIGGVLIFDGIIRVVRYYIEPITASSIGEGLISSIFELAVGITMIIKVTDIVTFFSGVLIWFACILMFCGAATIITGTTVAVVKKERKMWIAVIEYVLAACLIACGVVIIVKKSDAEAIMMKIAIILAGLFIIAVGIFALVSTFVPFQKLKAKRPVVEEVGRKESKPKKEGFFHKKHKKQEEKAPQAETVYRDGEKPNPDAGTAMEPVDEKPADEDTTVDVDVDESTTDNKTE